MPDIAETATEKLGPLPVWAWAAIGGGGILLIVVLASRSQGGTIGTVATGGTPLVSGIPVEQAAQAVQDAIAKTTTADQTAFAAQIQAAKDQAAAALAAQTAAYNAQQTTANQAWADKLAAAVKSGQDAYNALKAQDATAFDQQKSLIDSITADLNARLAALNKTIEQLRAQATGAATGSNPTPAYVWQAGDPMPDPNTDPVNYALWKAAQVAQVVTGGSGIRLPDWLAKYVTRGATVEGYNKDHWLPASLAKIRQDAAGFIFPDGSLLARWYGDIQTVTPVKIGNTMIDLPTMFDQNQSQARYADGHLVSEHAINLVIQRLNSLAAGSPGWGAISSDPTDPRNVYIITRGVIEDFVHQGYKPIDTGFVQADRFLQGSM